MTPEQAAKLTGPRHYQFAVGMLCEIQKSIGAGEIETDDDAASVGIGIAAAQVHATLSLAAAVIEVARAISAAAGGTPFPDVDWDRAVEAGDPS